MTKKTLILPTLFILTVVVVIYLVYRAEGAKPTEVISGADTTHHNVKNKHALSQNDAVDSTLDATDAGFVETGAENLLNEFVEYTPQQIAVELFTDPRVKGNSAEVLLELIRRGVIDANESLKVGTTHYTPLYAALVSGNELTAAELQVFVDLGSHIGASKTWLRAMARLRNEDALSLWADVSGTGPEHYDNLLLYALIEGNPQLNSFVREKIPHRTGDSLLKHEVVIASYNSVIEGLNVDTLSTILESENPHKKANLMGYERRLQQRLGQIEVLISHGTLTTEQLKNMRASGEQYRQIIAQVQKLL